MQVTRGVRSGGGAGGGAGLDRRPSVFIALGVGIACACCRDVERAADDADAAPPEKHWLLEAELVGEPPEPGFGQSVALSGDTALVGAAGHAFVFVREGTTWTQQADLRSAAGPDLRAFGSSVDLAGDTAIVTGWEADGSRAAHIFVRSGTTWSEQARLVPSAPGEDYWGVAISGETAVIGGGDSTRIGVAYVFVRSGTTWTQQATLPTSDQCCFYVALAGEVALDGDTALFETEVATHTFERSGPEWVPGDLLPPAEDSPDCSASLALSGDTALIPTDAVHVFVRDGSGRWSEQAQMELAGRAVGIDHDVAILSGGSGAKTFAHTFDFFLRSGTSWTFQETIEPDLGWDFNGDGCDRAALEDDTAIVASYDAGYDGSGRGRASVYRFTTPP